MDGENKRPNYLSCIPVIILISSRQCRIGAGDAGNPLAKIFFGKLVRFGQI